jgi:ribosomal protein S15P/S13E
MASRNQRKGASYKDGYKQYKLENRAETNKIKKLEAHLKKYPKDVQAQKALVTIKKEGAKYARRKPTNRGSSDLSVKDLKKIEGEEKIYNMPKLRGRPYRNLPIPTVYPTIQEMVAKIFNIKIKQPSKPRKPKIRVKRARA